MQRLLSVQKRRPRLLAGVADGYESGPVSFGFDHSQYPSTIAQHTCCFSIYFWKVRDA